MQTKKGFILIYTLLVGIICLIIMMYIFDIQKSEIQYSTSNKRYVLRNDNYQRDKEHLMTLFYAYIDTKKSLIKEAGITKEAGIINFFHDFKGSIVSYKTAKVSYLDKPNEFIFATHYKDRTNRNDYYKLENLDEDFKLVFLRTKYVDK